MVVNQMGDEVLEQVLDEWSSLSIDELQTIVFTLLSKAGLEVIRTNATKSGKMELVIKPELKGGGCVIAM